MWFALTIPACSPKFRKKMGLLLALVLIAAGLAGHSAPARVSMSRGVEARRDARHSFGLFNIQERVADLDGRVAITCSPGAGASVSLVLPFRGTEAL